MKIHVVLPLIALLTACSSGQQNTAGKPQAVTGWQVVTTAKDADNGLCYAYSAPVRSHGSYTGKRAKPYLMATRRKSGKIEVSVSSGYSYKQGSTVSLVTGNSLYKMKAKDSVAWAHNDAQDKYLLTRLEKNDSVEVRGVTASNETTVDVYSTEGFDDALERVKALCP